jgi:hypothetical protein
MSYERKGKKKKRCRKKSDLLSIGLSRPSAAASASKRFPKPLTLSPSLSLRDISILASFDGSENAVGIRWKLHPSIFFWFGAKREEVIRGVRGYSAPTMWRMMRVGEMCSGRRKEQSYIYNFRISLVSFSLFYIFSAFSLFSRYISSKAGGKRGKKHYDSEEI